MSLASGPVVGKRSQAHRLFTNSVVLKFQNVQNKCQFFRNENVCSEDIGPLRQEYAEKGGLMTQPRRKLFSSFELTNGTINTPLPLFYSELGLVCTKVYCLVEYTLVNCFNNIEQDSSVETRCHGDKKKQLQCCCKKYEVPCKQVVWLSIFRLQSPFSCKVHD